MSGFNNSALNIDALKFKLQQRLGNDLIDLVYLPTCKSTNTECLNHSNHGTVELAEKQTAGRGRRGNNWHSPSKQNIYCSIGIKKTIQAEHLGLISLVVGISIVDTLQRLGITDIGVKWPNDILLQGRKLGGVLIETKVLSHNEFYLAIGFGLNVNLSDKECKDIGQPAISLKQLDNVTFDRQQLLVELIPQILQQTMSFEEGSIDKLIQQFHQFDSYAGKEVVVKTRTEEILGITVGLERTGWLKVKTEHGVQSFSAAEISLRERVTGVIN